MINLTMILFPELMANGISHAANLMPNLLSYITTFVPMKMSILTTFTNWFGEIFGGEYFVDLALELWENCTDLASSVLSEKPNGGNFVSLWLDAQYIYTKVFLPVGETVMCVCFLVALIRDSLNLKQVHLDYLLKQIIKLVICSAVLNNALTWMKYMFNWASSLVDDINVRFNGKIYTTTGLIDISEWSWTNIILGFFLGLLFLVVTLVCCVMILMAVYGRIFKICVIVPYAPVALGTIAAGGELSRTGYAWIKTFLGYVFEVAVIAIMLGLGKTFIYNVTIGGDDPSLALQLILAALRVLIVTTAVKGADQTLKRSLALG